ncbi:MAG: hypothetical protein A2Y25_04100 [Candidatus Melainabacteria bacterium GWF2_37_15]|nr:MAG: hypothetical protein A2Y25_04100 [Candidatus Melainabacteria bacterium GWF2_37_15]
MNKSDNFIKNYPASVINIEPRNNSIDLWRDILTYSVNLSGNWMLSKQVFYVCIAPTAEKNPARFAAWIMEMVNKSDIKIKSRAEFIEAIDYLRKLDGKTDKSGIKKALYHLFQSGLAESLYASRALKNSA